MAHGQSSSRTQAALDQLWRAFLQIDPQTARESVLYDQSLSTLRDMSDSRRLRLFSSRNDLPLVIQFLLGGGGLITTTFTYFFGIKSIRAQSLMTAGSPGSLLSISFWCSPSIIHFTALFASRPNRCGKFWGESN